MDLLNKVASPLVKQKMLSAISHPLDEAGFTPMDYIHYMSVSEALPLFSVLTTFIFSSRKGSHQKHPIPGPHNCDLLA